MRSTIAILVATITAAAAQDLISGPLSVQDVTNAASELPHLFSRTTSSLTVSSEAHQGRRMQASSVEDVTGSWGFEASSGSASAKFGVCVDSSSVVLNQEATSGGDAAYVRIVFHVSRAEMNGDFVDMLVDSCEAAGASTVTGDAGAITCEANGCFRFTIADGKLTVGAGEASACFQQVSVQTAFEGLPTAPTTVCGNCVFMVCNLPTVLVYVVWVALALIVCCIPTCIVVCICRCCCGCCGGGGRTVIVQRVGSSAAPPASPTVVVLSPMSVQASGTPLPK